MKNAMLLDAPAAAAKPVRNRKAVDLQLKKLSEAPPRKDPRRTEFDARLKAAGLDGDTIRELHDLALPLPPDPCEADGKKTDLGLARIFVEDNHLECKYVHPWRAWLIWYSHYWRRDESETVSCLMKDTVCRMLEKAARLSPSEAKTEFYKWALKCESEPKMRAALVLARSEPEITADPADFDQYPLLLACANGVLDLTTGQLRDGLRGDMLTLAVPHDFDPSATCPRWEQFLAEVLPDPDVRRFVSRAIGYTITGLMREQCFFLCTGTGCNGKSVLLSTLAKVLGPLAMNLPFSSFTARRDSATNDLAALPGKRLVSASETGETSALDEARIKALTGQDILTARRLYQEFAEFTPTCKLWLACNHRPAVRDDTYAFWRRVRCITFPRQLTPDEIDPDLPDKLTAEAPGILAWAVRQALDYLLHGLPAPDAVRVATDYYRVESDPLADFLDERYEKGPDLAVSFHDIYQDYCEWAITNRFRPSETLSRTAVGSRLCASFRKGRDSHGGRMLMYYGLGPRRHSPQEAEE